MKPELAKPAYFDWRKKCAGLMPSEMKRLCELEQENERKEDRPRSVFGQGDASERDQAETQNVIAKSEYFV